MSESQVQTEDGALYPYDALTCAAVVDPSKVSRNRYFDVYKDPFARQAHLRGHRLRRLARHIVLVHRELGSEPLVMHVEPHDDGLTVSYHYASLSIFRTIHLDALEASLLRWLLIKHRKAKDPLLTWERKDFQRITAALQAMRNHPTLPDPASLIERVRHPFLSQTPAGAPKQGGSASTEQTSSKRAAASASAPHASQATDPDPQP